MNQETNVPSPIHAAPLVSEVVPVAAQRLTAIPNRSTRNENYVEVGSLKLDAGTIRVMAYKKDGSLLVIMPGAAEGFLIDTGIVASQCYKYWKLKQQAGLDESAAEPTQITSELLINPDSHV